MKMLLMAVLLGAFLGCSTNMAPAAPPTPYDLTQEEFKQRMDEPDVVILDVRTPAETSLGMIDEAEEIDFKAGDFADRIDSLDRNKTYLVYCRSGNRSGKACALMDELGFREVHNLEGGYMGWMEER